MTWVVEISNPIYWQHFEHSRDTVFLNFPASTGPSASPMAAPPPTSNWDSDRELAKSSKTRISKWKSMWIRACVNLQKSAKSQRQQLWRRKWLLWVQPFFRSRISGVFLRLSSRLWLWPRCTTTTLRKTRINGLRRSRWRKIGIRWFGWRSHTTTSRRFTGSDS